MYLYHLKPEIIVGDRLVPRNSLRSREPELYRKYTEKYANRPHVLDIYIAPLHCRWGDVVFLTPVHPGRIIRALRACGYKKRLRASYFEIDPCTIDRRKAVIWLGQPYGRSDNAYIPYHPSALVGLESVPRETRLYYRRRRRQYLRPLLWHGVAHVLYKGEIDISSAHQITL